MSYFERNVRYHPLDAVNLIFAEPINLVEVEGVLDSAGWKTHTLQEHQFLADDHAVLASEESYRVKPIVDWLPDWLTRHLGRWHVRLWRVGNKIVGAAHKEHPSLIAFHSVESFDDGRDVVAAAFANNPSYRVLARAVYIGTKIRAPKNDGWATVISKA